MNIVKKILLRPKYLYKINKLNTENSWISTRFVPNVLAADQKAPAHKAL